MSHGKGYILIGSKIRGARNKIRISQQKLADSIDISKGRLGRIERGEVSPTVDELRIIAAALNVNLSDLLVK